MKKRKGETGPLSQGVQAGRQALRMRHIHGVEVRRKRPRGSSEPLEPLSLSPRVALRLVCKAGEVQGRGPDDPGAQRGASVHRGAWDVGDVRAILTATP